MVIIDRLVLVKLNKKKREIDESKQKKYRP